MAELQSHDAPCLYVPRSAWGLTDDEAYRRGMVIQPLFRPELYLHHQGAGAATRDPIGWVRALDDHATGIKGYKAVDYSAGVVRIPGAGGAVAIVEMRGRYAPGATYKRNYDWSKAICLAGDRKAVDTSPEEREALRWLAFAMVRSGWLDADFGWYGHRDNPAAPGATSCPGDDAYDDLPDLRRPWAPAPPPPPPTAPEDNEMTTRYVRRNVARPEDDGRVWHVNFDIDTRRPAPGSEFYGVLGLDYMNGAVALSDDQLRELGIDPTPPQGRVLSFAGVNLAGAGAGDDDDEGQADEADTPPGHDAARDGEWHGSTP